MVKKFSERLPVRMPWYVYGVVLIVLVLGAGRIAAGILNRGNATAVQVLGSNNLGQLGNGSASKQLTALQLTKASARLFAILKL